MYIYIYGRTPFWLTTKQESSPERLLGAITQTARSEPLALQASRWWWSTWENALLAHNLKCWIGIHVFLGRSHTNKNSAFRLDNPVYDMDMYIFKVTVFIQQAKYARNMNRMNEARLSHLPFWGPSEVFFLINSTAVGLTRMNRSSFGLRVRVNPWVNLGERFIRVNPTDV